MKVVYLGIKDYLSVWHSMKSFTLSRNNSTQDQIWLTQHPRVFTQGISSKNKDLLELDNIPVVNTDRGGKITYHAQGQLVVYLLIDLIRLKLGIRKMILKIQYAIIDLLADYNIKGHLKDKAPGVYVNFAKIAAIGIRVKNGKTYHGLSLNVDMDLEPFSKISPCGYSDLKITQISDLYHKPLSFNAIAKNLSYKLCKQLTSKN